MRVVHGKIGSKKNLGEDLCVTFGNFDGVHLGHQNLINETKKYGKTSVVFTFNPHPACITRNHFEYYFLTPLSRKIDLIRDLNPDYLYIIDFDYKQATLDKDFFIKWLLDLNVKHIVCGKDWRFAYKKEGSIADLKDKFECIEVENLVKNGKRISSTYAKELLMEGNIKLANEILGRKYFIEGHVVHGNSLGRTIGFKTANIDILGNVAPKNGVYAVKVVHDNECYLGMCNIGYNPTMNMQKNLRLETHIFNFEKEIYGDNIIIYFIDFIRQEVKFDSKEELIAQLNKDKNNIIERFGGEFLWNYY